MNNRDERERATSPIPEVEVCEMCGTGFRWVHVCRGRVEPEARPSL